MDLATFETLMFLLALILFLIVAFGGFFPKIAGTLQNKINLTALGLALWGLVFLIDYVNAR